MSFFLMLCRRVSVPMRCRLTKMQPRHATMYHMDSKNLCNPTPSSK